MTQPHDPAGVSRRSFLKGSAVLGIAANTPLPAPAPRGPQTFGPGDHRITLTINGVERAVVVETRTTLLDALRDRLDLTGAKKVCDRGACGACTVLVDDQPVNSCMLLAMDAVGTRIRTVEGLAGDERNGAQAHPLVQQFVHCDALQCGFCTPGMVMSSLACLERHGRPSREQMQHDLAGNLCRCGTYGRVMQAIERTAEGHR